MSDISYLKNASTDVVAAACKQYGAIAFIGVGITEIQKLETLSAAVQDLDRQLTQSKMFFTTHHDSLYADTIYSIEDFNPDFSMVWIKKTIVFKSTAHVTLDRKPEVEMGPVVPREKAQAIVEAMNAR